MKSYRPLLEHENLWREFGDLRRKDLLAFTQKLGSLDERPRYPCDEAMTKAGRRSVAIPTIAAALRAH